MSQQMANTNAVQSIAALTGAVGDDLTWLSLWSLESGGVFLHRQSISTDPSALALGQRFNIAAAAMKLIQPTATGETEGMAERKIRGAILGGVWIQWHTGDPGSAGTSNVITELGRTNVLAADFTLTTV